MLYSIGGFHGGDPNDQHFRELFVRWFQWGTYCPVMRLHGDREPRQPHSDVGRRKGAAYLSGADNEVWSYGEDVYEICKKYMKVREDMRDYTRSLMEDAHKRGTPIMRPLFYDFPGDAKCWDVETQYMYGPKYLCCPVFEANQRRMSAYLPAGAQWIFDGTEEFAGGQTVEVDCPIEVMPVFVRQRL